jgi:hypothetical protein
MQRCENGNCHPDGLENVVTQTYEIFKEDIGQSEKKAGSGTIYDDETAMSWTFSECGVRKAFERHEYFIGHLQ